MNLMKAKWYFNRLKAMNFNEVKWRMSQKKLQSYEKRRYKDSKISIINNILDSRLNNVINRFNYEKFGINFDNDSYTTNNILWLFDKYDYTKIKDNWNYGFNDNNYWGDEFSYDLQYKQNDRIGDARTNWELNRHFQFAILAKNYYVTKEEKYINELTNLFYDWTEKNPFLRGISWTSVMEVAIRAVSWIVTLVFLEKVELKNETIKHDLKVGIINMIDYVEKHHSQYSSANNHLIVEMASIGIAGIMFEYEPWIKKSIDILDYEIFKQNTLDGVNKECSIHYQSFVMESIALFMIVMDKNNISYPESWKELLNKMSEFIADNMDENYEVSNLGDSDEGKILDLYGGKFNHYKYVLELTSILLKREFKSLETLNENINWLFTEEEISSIENSYDNSMSKCYKIGGYTIMKSKLINNNRIRLVIDHAELGYGSIAAHGHADTLSFTMNINGKNVFIDPGTYIYHIDIKSRDYFRKTYNHNTICFNDVDQSEMLGAFLWGRKAKPILDKYSIDDKNEILIVGHDGYLPNKHVREFHYDRENKLVIKDNIVGKKIKWTSTLILDPSVQIISLSGNKVKLRNDLNYVDVIVNEGLIIEIEEVWISEIYSNKFKSKALKIKGCSDDFKLITEVIVY